MKSPPQITCDIYSFKCFFFGSGPWINLWDGKSMCCFFSSGCLIFPPHVNYCYLVPFCCEHFAWGTLVARKHWPLYLYENMDNSVLNVHISLLYARAIVLRGGGETVSKGSVKLYSRLTLLEWRVVYVVHITCVHFLQLLCAFLYLEVTSLLNAFS